MLRTADTGCPHATKPILARMQITVNGESRSLDEGATISDLLRSLDLPGTRVAVEVNKELVRRAQHGERVLVPGDQVEVVTFVGGG